MTTKLESCRFQSVGVDGAIQVLLDERAAAQLLELVSPLMDFETGGILVGYYSADGLTATIMHATGPPPDSSSSGFNFRRGTAGVNALLESLWPNGLQYLGEWHFHPGDAMPSRTDHASMRRIARRREAHCAAPILIIVGRAQGCESLQLTAHAYFDGKSATKLTRETA